MENIWLDGMIGLVTGDALGCPVQFLSREEIKQRGGVTGMEGYGTFNMPEGTWTDDSSMAIATLDSIRNKGEICPEDIMNNFLKWEYRGYYTPFGYAFDQGSTCLEAIWKFKESGDWKTCGKTGEYANGNGALMRILPVCLYYIARRERVCTSDDEAIYGIHLVSGLTHNHLRSQMACGLYYFMAKEIVENKKEQNLNTCLKNGFDKGKAYYGQDLGNLNELNYFSRMFDLQAFQTLPDSEIRSTGYVLDSFEAAIWCLLNTKTYKDCILKAVNLGADTDTVAAIAGGLAGLFYGYGEIPEAWLNVIKCRTRIEDMCIGIMDNTTEDFSD